jgi:putative glutamine amidotransferase
MTSRPLVALTTTSVAQGGTHARPQILLYSAYIRALEVHGLAPLLVTPHHAAGSVHALLERCCGLVLSGGEDVDPLRYGEQPHPLLETVTPERDEMEWTALGIALERGLPVFAICRGVQLLNVFFGGTLYQDIGAQYPTQLRHAQDEPWGERSHRVTVDDDSLLRRIVGTDTLLINSFHHQAIKDVAPALRVTAVAEDGLIECVEATQHPWVIGVQWHPERHEARAPESDPDRRLFAAFRDAVTERAEGCG